jgi:hypothetical protein
METTLTPEESDWLTAYNAWSDMMYQEAADRGYDYAAARTASDHYFAAKGAYEAAHGTAWVESPQRAGELYAKRRVA